MSADHERAGESVDCVAAHDDHLQACNLQAHAPGEARYQLRIDAEYKRKSPRLQTMKAVAQGSIVVFLAVDLVAGCVPSGDLRREQATTPTFDPAAFFAGRTEGRGVLMIVAHRRQTTLVEGGGVPDAEGDIVLDQDVRRGEAAPMHREWRLRRVAPNRYAGTLTDAVGPVRGEVVGNHLTLAFTMKGGLRARQWLYLRPGGQVARNRMVITRFGLPVASLDETIVRQPS